MQANIINWILCEKNGILQINIKWLMKPKFVSSLYTYYITIQSRAALSILWGKLSGHINAKLRLASNVGYLLKTILFSGGSMQTLANFKPSKASLIVAEFPQLKPNWLLMLGSQSVHRERCSERFPPWLRLFTEMRDCNTSLENCPVWRWLQHELL